VVKTALRLHEIVEDIHGLEAELAVLEDRYGLLSPDFYHLYKTGELDQTKDFIQWVGYYEAKLARQSLYREVLYEHLRRLRQAEGRSSLRLLPEAVPAGGA